LPGPTSDRNELVYSEVAGSTQVMGITDLRPHPGRILTVLGAPIAFAIKGFLHLVADADAPDIYTGLKSHAGLWIAIHVVQLLLILLLAVAIYWLTDGLTSISPTHRGRARNAHRSPASRTSWSRPAPAGRLR
jgi:hypothetical protein